MKDLNEGIYPSDIKKMSVHEMELLCAHIREKLIAPVSETGGHLATNLGVVELTMAMHYVFDAPEDKIVWDVGHQSYIHKMLTGRAAEFSTLRQLDGLSGTLHLETWTPETTDIIWDRAEEQSETEEDKDEGGKES